MNLALVNEIEEFWNEKMLEVGNAKQIHSIGLPTMRLKILPNELDSSCETVCRPVIANWSDDHGIVGYAQAAMVGPRRSGRAIDAISLLMELDNVSQESYDFAELLVESHVDQNPFKCTSDGPRWLVDFRKLEVHPSRLGNKLGVRLGAQFLDELRQLFKIGLFVLKPYPLQYSRGDGPRVFQSAEENPQQFQKDSQKLRQLYCNAWGAAALPGTDDHLFVLGSTKHTLVPRKGGRNWSLEQF
ncbi:MAG: hypothetical protein IPG23_13585 [Burkholderiales bacterium]|jgi:hypothetical protein|nr:hypothetical protein [Burkholderiales bacterium]